MLPDKVNTNVYFVFQLQNTTRLEQIDKARKNGSKPILMDKDSLFEDIIRLPTHNDGSNIEDFKVLAWEFFPPTEVNAFVLPNKDG